MSFSQTLQFRGRSQAPEENASYNAQNSKRIPRIKNQQPISFCDSISGLVKSSLNFYSSNINFWGVPILLLIFYLLLPFLRDLCHPSREVALHDYTYYKRFPLKFFQKTNTLDNGIPSLSEDFQVPTIPRSSFPPPTPKEHMFQKMIRFADKPESWEMCLNQTKIISPEPMFETPKKFIGCVAYMLGNNPVYLDEIAASFDVVAKSLTNLYPDIAIIIHHHYVWRPEQLDYLRQQAKSKNITNIFFERFHVPTAVSRVSSKNPELIPERIAHFWLEYRYQTVVFVEDVFQSQSSAQCEYILRIDADITILEPFTYNPFLFAKMHNLPYMIHHWGYESGLATYSCSSIRPASALWLMSRPKEWFSKSAILKKNAKQQKSETPKLNDYDWKKMAPFAFNAGGAFTIIKRDLFASQPIRNYLDFFNCLGGVYTHRWADQMVLPLIFSLFFDFGRNSYLMNDVPLLHKGLLYPPHNALQEWPKFEVGGKPNLVIADSQESKKYKACFAIFQNFETKKNERIEELARTIRNLYVHGISELKSHRNGEYPILLFFNSGKLSENDKTLLLKQVDDKTNFLEFAEIPLDPKVEESEFWAFLAFSNEQSRKYLAKYQTIMKIDVGTNILAPISFDSFKFFEDLQYDIGYFKVWSLQMVEHCMKHYLKKNQVSHRKCLFKWDYSLYSSKETNELKKSWKDLDGTKRLGGWGVGRFSRIWEPTPFSKLENQINQSNDENVSNFEGDDIEMLKFVHEKARKFFGFKNEEFLPPAGFMYLGPFHILRTETFLSREYSDFSRFMKKQSLQKFDKNSNSEGFSHIFSGESLWPLFIGFYRGKDSWKSVHHFAQMTLNYGVDDTFPESHFFGVGRTTETLTSHYLDGFPFEYANYRPCNVEGLCPPLEQKEQGDISEIVCPGVDDF